MDTFEKALKFTLQWEGGFVDDPADHGGATNFGITQYTYNKYTGDTDSVKDITPYEVQAIYRQRYWDEIHGTLLPPDLAIACFDYAVNSGSQRAIDTLRLSMQTKDPLRDYLNRRESFYKSIGVGSQKRFIKGWLNRLNALRKYLGVV